MPELPPSFLELVLETLPVAILAIGADGSLLFANDQACDLLGQGVRPSGGPGPAGPIHHPFIAGTGERYPRERIPIVRALAGEEAVASDLELRLPDRTVPVTAWARPARAPDGRIVGAVSTFSDITRLRATEQALVEAQNLFRYAFDAAPIGMAVVGVDGRWLEVNPALCELTGYTATELQERTFQDITHPEDLDADLALLSQLLAGEIPDYRIDKRYIRADGGLVWVRLAVSILRDVHGGVPYLISQIQDITAEKLAADALNNAAATDLLTGLANRRHAIELLASAQASVRTTGRHSAVLFIDLNGFKAINDGLGHDVGDAVLREIGSRLKAHLRPGDFAVRWGGDEFLCILNGLAPNEDPAFIAADQVAHRLTAAVARPLEATPAGASVRCSIGISFLGANEDPLDCVRRADKSMYGSKHGPSNR